MGLDFWRDLGGLLAFAFALFAILSVFGFIEFYVFLVLYFFGLYLFGGWG